MKKFLKLIKFHLTWPHKQLFKKLKSIDEPVIYYFNKTKNFISFTSSNNFKNECLYGFDGTVIKNENLVYTYDYTTYEYLLEIKYIKEEESRIIITYSGLHKIKIIFKKFCIFLYKSVFIPTIIAIITTLIYNRYLK